VVRVAGDFVAPLIERPIDEVLPVDELILGVRAIGQARVQGRPRVVLVDDPHDAAFTVSLSGVIESRTVGCKGPVQIHSRCQTRFTADKRVFFEPGRGFVGEPARIDAQTSTATERIESDRGGILGRMIERRAWLRASENRDQVNQIVHARIEVKIRETFDRLLASRLARVNELANQGAIAAELLLGDREPSYRCCTRGGYLQIAAGPGATSVELPLAGASGPRVQIWLHEGTVGDQVALIIRQIDLARRALRESTLVGTLLESQLPLTQSTMFRAGNTCDFTTIGDWVVLHSPARMVDATRSRNAQRLASGQSATGGD
jgi:hypothetical protein